MIEMLSATVNAWRSAEERRVRVSLKDKEDGGALNLIVNAPSSQFVLFQAAKPPPSRSIVNWTQTVKKAARLYGQPLAATTG